MLSFWLSSQLLYTAGSKPTVGDEGKLSHYSCRVITIVVELSAVTRDLGRDDWIKEFIKQITGLFWAVGTAEKKIPTAISMQLFGVVF